MLRTVILGFSLSVLALSGCKRTSTYYVPPTPACPPAAVAASPCPPGTVPAPVVSPFRPQ